MAMLNNQMVNAGVNAAFDGKWDTMNGENSVAMFDCRRVVVASAHHARPRLVEEPNTQDDNDLGKGNMGLVWRTVVFRTRGKKTPYDIVIWEYVI